MAIGTSKSEDRQIIDVKYIFYGPCKPWITSKAGYKFVEDDAANARYKALKEGCKYE